MSNMVSVGQFWVDNDGDVYEVVKALKNDILVHHTWKNEAWRYDSVKNFKSEMKTLLTDKRHARTEILADVIKQLDAKKFIATNGTYCNMYYGDRSLENQYVSHELDNNLQSVICDDKFKCQVCALGSLFVASVDVNNKLKTSKYINEYFSDNDMVDHLHKWFSEKELRLIEYAFEGGTCLGSLNDSWRVISEFRNSCNTDTKSSDYVLRQIIANTIKHGSFKPELGLA